MKRIPAFVFLLSLCLSSPAQNVTREQIAEIRGSFVKDAQTTAIQNVLIHNDDIEALAVSKSNLALYDRNFKYKIKSYRSAPDQQRSGRCWLFSSLNYLRPLAIEKFGVKDFRFSPNSVSFWDLFEKSNRFLENVIRTAGQDNDSREVAYIFKTVVWDGGEWHSFINIAGKYGVVPEEVMPETPNSNNTAQMREVLKKYLRKQGWKIREMMASGTSAKAARKYKMEVMKDVYRILALCLGEPPAEFTWRYSDKNGKEHTIKTTPREFYRSIVPQEFENSRVMIMNDPSREYYKMYRIAGYNNVIEGVEWTYLNLPASELKPSLLACIKAGEPAYICCDWRKQMVARENKIAMGNVDLESLFGMEFDMSREARMRSRYSTCAHVMIIDAVDVDDNGNTTKWRLFNSSHTCGAGVHLIMADNWFDEYAYRIVTGKQYLSPKAQAALSLKPEDYPLYVYDYMR